MWLTNIRAVLPDEVVDGVSIRLDGAHIAEIEEGPPPADAGNVVDGGGRLLLPGFVDMHGDMIEREVEPRANAKMPMALGLNDLDNRLLAAGITTAYASLSFDPKSAYGHMRSYDHSKAMLRALKAARPTLAVDHRVHARFEFTFPRGLGVVEELIADGTVDLVSLMDHTPGQGQSRDLEGLVKRLQEEGRSRAEAETVVAERIATSKAEAGDVLATLEAMAQLCAKAGVPMASHDDDTPEKVALMHRIGARISEFPVTLEAAKAAKQCGMVVAMGAPNALRGFSTSGNLSAREAHAAGVMDMLAADYHPSAILPAVQILAATDDAGLPGAVRLATAGPAAALGLDDRGRLEVGLRADLILVEKMNGSGAEEAGGARIDRVCAVFTAGQLVWSKARLV